MRDESSNFKYTAGSIVLRSPGLGWPHFTTIVDHSTLHFTTLVYHPHLTPDLLVVRQSYFHFQNRDQYGWRGLIRFTFISPLTYGGVPVYSCNQQYCQPPSLLFLVVQNSPLASIFHPLQGRPK